MRKRLGRRGGGGRLRDDAPFETTPSLPRGEDRSGSASAAEAAEGGSFLRNARKREPAQGSPKPRAERESNPRARICSPRSSQRFGSNVATGDAWRSAVWHVERTAGIEPASAVWKTAVLPFDDVRGYRLPPRRAPLFFTRDVVVPGGGSRWESNPHPPGANRVLSR